MIKQQQQTATASRKPASAAMAVSSPGSPNGNPLPSARSQERAATGRGRSIVKGLQPPVFDGVYNNSRMLHYLTAVVGSTCDVQVASGSTYEGIFRTLSSKFDLAVDAVHKKTGEETVGPKREDIVDTMIFRPSDVALMHFHNVDFSYATKDKFTDSAIATNSKVNGEHKDKVLMRWDGGETNTDDYDLDSDVSNGWDAHDMFRFNEDNYGVKTTYDSSLSSYTVPLEKDNSDEFRQREARATQIAREIESSPQYRARIAIENEDGRTEEEKHSGVQRPTSDRDSPSFGSRDAKYVPLPQRVRDGSRGGLRMNPSRGGRSGMGPIPSRSTPQHYPESSSSPVSEQRGINGGPSRMSPKSQRPMRGSKTTPSPSSRPVEVSTSPSAASRVYTPLSPKSVSSTSSMDSSSQASTPDSRPAAETNVVKPSSPKAAAAAVVGEGKETPLSAVKEPSRTLEQTAAPSDVKPPPKAMHTEQKRNQLDELRKFGAEFRLQPSTCPEPHPESLPSRQKEPLETKVPKQEGACSDSNEPQDLVQKVPEPVEEVKEDVCETTELQEEACGPPVKTEAEEKEEAIVYDQVKKSTLNPNAKEFNPKSLLAVNKATSTPTSPGPRNHPPTTPTIPMQSGVYSPYLPYIHQIHMSPAVQAPQMYQYPVSNSVPGQQGKYRTKGPTQRAEQQNAAPPIMQAAAAAGPPLVAATPYSSYISYSPQQFPGQPAMMQPMAHYAQQPMFAQMLQGNPRMLASGNHPQALVSSNPQYPPTEQPTPQTLYAAVQSYSHHAAQLHPQPASTPTQNQQQSQHANPSPVQHQGGQPPHLGSGQPQQNLYHPATLTATPPSLTPGPTAQSPQSSYTQQAVYAIHAHQQLQHSFTNMSHVAQAHVQTGLTGAPPHPGAPHPPHPGAPHPAQVMLLHPSQTHAAPPQAAVQQTGVSTPSPYTYISHHQVQSHPPQQLPFHPPGN